MPGAFGASQQNELLPSGLRGATPLRPGSAAALKRTYSNAASAPSGSAGSAPLARAEDGDGGGAFPLDIAARGPPRPSLMAACTCVHERMAQVSCDGDHPQTLQALRDECV